MIAPQFILLARSNGSGKSTGASILLPPALVFLNADEIARRLPMEDSPAKDLQAGRELLRRWDELRRDRVSFAIETTLSNRSLAPRIHRLHQEGYEFHLIFLWLVSPDLAVERVADRVRRGGNDIPEATIRRRYYAGISNFFEIYQPMSDYWQAFDNSITSGLSLIASSDKSGKIEIADPVKWISFQEFYHDDRR